MRSRKFFYNGFVRIRIIDEDGVSFVVNGYKLKIYNKQNRRTTFVSFISQQDEMEVVKHVSVTSIPLPS
jgi:hypothetical protein